MDDRQLIQEYVAQRSESAFAELVDRYLNLVHAAAARQVRDSLLAQDVCQAVFILFARKAASLPRDVVLPGWFYRTTCFVAARSLRAERRRQQREQEAVQMQEFPSNAEDSWSQLAPLLDEGMAKLSVVERDAVLLRFFQESALEEVGRQLGITEEAARKRISRAIEKLRAFFCASRV